MNAIEVLCRRDVMWGKTRFTPAAAEISLTGTWCESVDGGARSLPRPPSKS